MLRIRALNESSGSDVEQDDDTSGKVLTSEALDENLHSLYTISLNFLRNDDEEKAKDLLVTLLDGLNSVEDEKKITDHALLRYLTLKNLGDLVTDSIDYYLAALEIDSTDITLLIKTGQRAYDLRQNYPLARSCFERALKINPKNWIAIDWLLDCFFVLSDFHGCFRLAADTLKLAGQHRKAKVLLYETNRILPTLAKEAIEAAHQKYTQQLDEDLKDFHEKLIKELNERRDERIKRDVDEYWNPKRPQRPKLTIACDAFEGALKLIGLSLIKGLEKIEKDDVPIFTPLDLELDTSTLDEPMEGEEEEPADEEAVEEPKPDEPQPPPPPPPLPPPEEPTPTNEAKDDKNDNEKNEKDEQKDEKKDEKEEPKDEKEEEKEEKVEKDAEKEEKEESKKSSESNSGENSKENSKEKQDSKSAKASGPSKKRKREPFPVELCSKRRSPRFRGIVKNDNEYPSIDALKQLIPKLFQQRKMMPAMSREKKEMTAGTSTKHTAEEIEIQTVKELTETLQSQVASAARIDILDVIREYLMAIARRAHQMNVPPAFTSLYKVHRKSKPLPFAPFCTVGKEIQLDEVWLTLVANEVTFCDDEAMFLWQMLPKLESALDADQYLRYQVRLNMMQGMNEKGDDRLDYFEEVLELLDEKDICVEASNMTMITLESVETLIDHDPKTMKEMLDCIQIQDLINHLPKEAASLYRECLRFVKRF